MFYSLTHKQSWDKQPTSNCIYYGLLTRLKNIADIYKKIWLTSTNKYFNARNTKSTALTTRK